MALIDVRLPVDQPAVPGDVRAFLREAGRRMDRLQFDEHVPAFVASDFQSAYATLRALAEANLAPGDLFCEWGSGLGVVACLAAMLGFDARGIEIEPSLVEAAVQLAADFDLPVEFIQGSFIPPGGGRSLGGSDPFAWLTTAEGRAHEELTIEPEEFAVVFVYPWPDEERAIADLFDHCAGTGALLVSYHGGEGLRVRRKVAGRTRRARPATPDRRHG